MTGWFRHYVGLTTDPKFGGIARRSNATRERVVFVWCFILESASEKRNCGTFYCDPDAIADVLGCNTSDIEAILCQMETAGLIQKDKVVQWSNRQYETDSSAERVRLHRQRKRYGNADVTLQDRYVTAPDTDTDTDIENKHTVPRKRATVGEPSEEKGGESGGSAPCAPVLSGKKGPLKYHPDFIMLWETFPKHPNASKLEAHKAWQRLDEETRMACLNGACEYGDWLDEQRKKRSDYPGLHLATFINQRRWEAHLEAAQ
jgi:hypothetical protein